MPGGIVFFFFQAEDGIRDYKVTGVQTCALPIYADEALTRNFVRRRLGPLIESRFPRWRESLARAARHFAGVGPDAQALLREVLAAQGLRAPSEAKLVEMLKQLTSRGARLMGEHDRMPPRVYRRKPAPAPAAPAPP